jgi:hypothetical protein
LRRRITFVGRTWPGAFRFTDPITYLNQQSIDVSVPPNLAPGAVTLEVEICDCDACELNPGTGRCRTTGIPVFYQPSSATKPTSLQSTRPGSGDSPLRSKRP